MNPLLTIETEVRCGAIIDDAIKEAKTLSIRLGCNILFKFNGERIKVYPDSDVEKLITHYRKPKPTT